MMEILDQIWSTPQYFEDNEPSEEYTPLPIPPPPIVQMGDAKKHYQQQIQVMTGKLPVYVPEEAGPPADGATVMLPRPLGKGEGVEAPSRQEPQARAGAAGPAHGPGRYKGPSERYKPPKIALRPVVDVAYAGRPRARQEPQEPVRNEAAEVPERYDQSPEDNTPSTNPLRPVVKVGYAKRPRFRRGTVEEAPPYVPEKASSRPSGNRTTEHAVPSSVPGTPDEGGHFSEYTKARNRMGSAVPNQQAGEQRESQQEQVLQSRLPTGAARRTKDLGDHANQPRTSAPRRTALEPPETKMQTPEPKDQDELYRAADSKRAGQLASEKMLRRDAGHVQMKPPRNAPSRSHDQADGRPRDSSAREAGLPRRVLPPALRDNDPEFMDHAREAWQRKISRNYGPPGDEEVVFGAQRKEARMIEHGKGDDAVEVLDELDGEFGAYDQRSTGS
jgi:hypothetical protein